MKIKSSIKSLEIRVKITILTYKPVANLRTKLSISFIGNLLLGLGIPSPFSEINFSNLSI